MEVLVCFALLLNLVAGLRGDPQGDDAVVFQRNLPAEVVWAVPGVDAELPCDLSAPHGDRVIMVLWFKDATGVPLYSLDARNHTLGDAPLHWASTDSQGKRCHFLLRSSDPDHRAALKITNVQESDEGIFRCRVDFLNSPTRNYRVNLTMIEPPSTPQIMDAEGNEVMGVAGPFLEGYDMQMSCHVSGGRPRPDVSWWSDGLLVDDRSESVSTSYVVNRLFVGTVIRSLRNTVFECRAQSIPSAPPVSRKVSIEIFLKPLTVKITSPVEVLSAGKSKQISCESTGSFPPARITWWLDGEIVRHAVTTIGNHGNSTSSTLTLRPEAGDDSKELVCRAENPKFKGTIIEDRRYIRVAYPPVVSVSLGSNVGVSSLREGDSVTLTCDARAFPEADRITWYHGTKMMSRDEAGRVLELKRLSRTSSGEYVCVASNSEGASKSPPIYLAVQYAPVCRPGTENVVVGALRHETVTARCEVLADPGGDTLKFSWTYSKAKDVLPIPSDRVRSLGHVSLLNYTPIVESDFGTLACWASNPVGRQVKPCLLHIVHAKAPEPPRDCGVHNSSAGRLEVVCTAGNDGGLAQHFVLEVRETDRQADQATPGGKGGFSVGAPLYRDLGSIPRFLLHSMEPGAEYQLLIYAKNAMGVSEPPVLIQGVKVSSNFEKLAHSGSVVELATMAADYMPDLLVTGLLVAAGVILVCVLVVAMATLVSCRTRPDPGAAQFRLNNVHYGGGSRASSASREKRRSRASVQDEGGGE
ncbi:neural cell adhesion molecule 1-like [Macrosteles quadrilineatus]|uniref:neural cell adhesion molecule 1-like n=1 Tax=Macrosteles quadrilineatus TaxID=74068 RepID=UPI0023E2B92F|nr:neural cell adhesion molecule 1-like [Macrosteles quadrilineatus]